jgi:hypothetical protein
MMLLSYNCGIIVKVGTPPGTSSKLMDDSVFKTPTLPLRSTRKAKSALKTRSVQGGCMFCQWFGSGMLIPDPGFEFLHPGSVTMN